MVHLSLMLMLAFSSAWAQQAGKRPKLEALEANVVAIDLEAVGIELTGHFEKKGTDIAVTVGGVKDAQALGGSRNPLILGLEVEKKYELANDRAIALQSGFHRNPEELEITFIRPTLIKESCNQEISAGIGVEYFKDEVTGLGGLGVSVGGEIERNISDILTVNAAYNRLNFLNGDPSSSKDGTVVVGSGRSHLNTFQAGAELSLRKNASLQAGVEHRRLNANLSQPLEGQQLQVNRHATTVSVGMSIKTK
jgi:hypothetical protein